MSATKNKARSEVSFVQGRPAYGLIPGGEKLGRFQLDVQVCKPGKRAKVGKFKRVWIDTGADDTWLPGDELKALGIEVWKPKCPFTVADGRVIRRDVGFAVIKCQGFVTVDEVVFAEPGDFRLLGARAIEGFKVMVDPRNKKLVPGGPAVALSGTVNRRTTSAVRRVSNKMR